MSELKPAFELRRVRIALADILPVRQIKDPHSLRRYRAVLTSVKVVGQLEPMAVFPQKDLQGKYLLLDGHLRHCALKELGATEAECIIATDDEAYTYNARVNRLNPIAEHKMIVRAVQDGVQPERIAAALNLDVKDVRASMTLLDGISNEVADLLKDKPIASQALRFMRRVSAVRQIEIAELMISVNNYTRPYAEALVLGTPKDQLLRPHEPKKKKGVSREEIAKMEREMETLERDLKAVEQSYGENVLNLTCALGYVKKLLENVRVTKFLGGNHPDILAEFETLAASETV